jgi:hypothetical protein
VEPGADEWTAVEERLERASQSFERTEATTNPR